MFGKYFKMHKVYKEFAALVIHILHMMLLTDSGMNADQMLLWVTYCFVNIPDINYWACIFLRV